MDDYLLETSDGALSYLRKESLDIFNRLHSIEEDVLFVKQAHEAYPDTPILRSSISECPDSGRLIPATQPICVAELGTLTQNL